MSNVSSVPQLDRREEARAATHSRNLEEALSKPDIRSVAKLEFDGTILSPANSAHTNVELGCSMNFVPRLPTGYNCVVNPGAGEPSRLLTFKYIPDTGVAIAESENNGTIVLELIHLGSENFIEARYYSGDEVADHTHEGTWHVPD